MRVLLDSEPCDIDVDSIDEALQQAAAATANAGRVIVEVVIDGVPWTNEDLGSPERRSASAGEIALVSEDLNALVRQTLAHAGDALGEADELQRKAADFLQADKATDAMPLIDEAVGIWIGVHEAVTRSVDALTIDLDTVAIAAPPIPQRIDRLSSSLESLRAAFEARDMIGVSDVLLYELPEIVGQWREMLDVLVGLTSAGSEAGGTNGGEG